MWYNRKRALRVDMKGWASQSRAMGYRPQARSAGNGDVKGNVDLYLRAHGSSSVYKTNHTSQAVPLMFRREHKSWHNNKH